jgi:hypothetical protein
VVRVRGAVIYYPTQDWRVIVSVDGRDLNRAVRRRSDPKELRESTMVSVIDGKPVKGKLVFAKLVRLKQQRIIN